MAEAISSLPKKRARATCHMAEYVCRSISHKRVDANIYIKCSFSYASVVAEQWIEEKEQVLYASKAPSMIFLASC